MKKIYKLLSGTRQGLFALTLTVISGAAISQASYTFNNTGAVQTLTLPAGNWRIECWGANGGSITTLGGQGIGGYSSGEYHISIPGTVLNIFVGGRGFPATGNTSAAGAGGWNGGGGGAAIGRSGAGGGGATDVRVGGVADVDRVIVAGAGGGAAFYGSSLISSSVAPGGNGGDQVGQNGSKITSAGLITPGGGGAGANGATPGAASFILSNGTASGGGGGAQSFGSIGQQGIGGGAGGAPGPGGSGSTGGSAGGGGGYAGGAGGVQVGNQGVAGGGGSGYVGGVTSGTTIMFGQTGFVPNPDITGQGLVIITELCSIQAYAATGSNSISPEICPGGFVTLTSNAVGNYSWSTGQTSSSIIVSPSVSTVYTVTGTGSLVCSTSDTITVTVSSGPSITVSASNTIVCLGQSVVLTATGGDSYQWAGGPATAQYTVTPTTSGVYMVTGMHNLNSCVMDTTISVDVVIPNVTFPGNTQVCAGGSVTLTASGADLYTWSGITTGSNGVFVLQPVGTVTMTLVATTQSQTASCPLTNTFVVTVNPLPALTAIAQRSVSCTMEPNKLTATGAQTFTWSNGASGTVNVVTPSVSTIYTVTGTDANGCVGQTMVFALVSSCTGIEALDDAKEQFELYPNPSQGTFILKAEIPTDLLLINQLGQQLQTIKLSTENGFSLQITELKPGIYFVVPTKAGTGTVRKVIVQ
jgi:hypothetical protein